MPTISPIAFNTGSTIPGTTQIGNLSIGTTSQDYRKVGQDYGVTFYASPDQEIRHIIGFPDITASHLGQPGDVPARIGFYGTSTLNDTEFINLSQHVSKLHGSPQTFATTSAAVTWLNTNGYWASWVATLQVGDSYGGGKVGYIYQPGDPGYVVGEQHGLIAANTDYLGGSEVTYGGSGSNLSGTGSALGTGLSNTNNAVAIIGSGNYAPIIARNYTDGGYNDWFLPSIDELQKLYDNRTLIGGLNQYGGWTSTQADLSSAQVYLNYIFNGVYSAPRVSNLSLRACRYF
jgi:hypothetical protein